MEPTESEEKASPTQPADSAAVETAEPKNRRIVPVVCPGHNRPIVEVHFADTKDGLFHIAASLDSKAMLRSGETEIGSELLRAIKALYGLQN